MSTIGKNSRLRYWIDSNPLPGKKQWIGVNEMASGKRFLPPSQEINPQELHSRKRKPFPACCPQTSTNAAWHVCVTHIHVYAHNKVVINFNKMNR